MFRVWLALPVALSLMAGIDRAAAQAPPPPSGDIGERLARLEEGQRNLEKRFDDLNRRIDDLRADVNQRFADVNRRLDELHDFIIWGFGVTFAGMFSLIGFVLWDRRTALTPAVRRTDELHDREQRLETALRDYATRSPDLAESLRKSGLL
jgi:uncharacterized membrane-anchored protein YhcB (DUF1043 family)